MIKSYRMLLSAGLVIAIGCSIATAQGPRMMRPQQKPMVRDANLPADGNMVLISYGDKKLTLKDVETIVPSVTSQQAAQIAKQWLDLQLLYDAAKKRGLENDPKVKLLSDLNFKQEYARAMMEKVASEANVPESEIKDYYEKNKDKDQQMQEPNRFSFTHIKVKTAAEANSVIARIKAGEDPAEIAKKLSTAPDAKEGGAVRKAPQMQLKYQYGDEFVKALSDANEGQIIGPISVRGEYEVARHEGKLSARVLPFEKVKDQIKQNLQEKAKQEKTQQFLKELRTEAQPKVQESDFVKKMQSKNEPK